MDYIFLPSLEDMAIIKVAIALWNPNDIRDSMRRPSSLILSHIFLKDNEKWRQLEIKALEKIPHLLLHKNLEEKIETFVKMIGLQIMSWLVYHCATFICIDLPNEFCWTLHGTIDYKKTAEILVKRENIDITSRYILACFSCLQDDILNLWNKLPKNRRKYFYSGKVPRELRPHKLVVFWTCFIDNKLNRMLKIFGRRRSPYQYAFEIAAEEGNEAAAKYFLKKLTPTEKRVSCHKIAWLTARKLHNIEDKFDIPTQCMDFFCFLFSKMKEQQQTEVLELHSQAVLYCFLHWPRQRSFMEVARRAWDYISDEEYVSLLNYVRNKILRGCKDYNYGELLGKFWQQSYGFHKNYVIDWPEDNYIIADLFYINDIENIWLILKSASVIQRRKIIYSDYGKEICNELLVSGKWGFLKFFIRECIFSKNAMNSFKKEFNEYLAYENESIDQYVQSKMLQFCQLMNELIDENDRMSEDEISS